MIYALIPVKDLDGAKTRLGTALDAPARRDLVVAMYRDVLAAATACPILDGVFVVSRDEDVLAMSKAMQVRTFVPNELSTSSGSGGLNRDLTMAAEAATELGATRLLVLFADLPLVNADAIERIVQAAADVALIRSRDGGTNAMAMAPGAIEFRYGPDSAAKHITAAERAGLTIEQINEPSLALDIDTIDDLEALRNATGVGAHTKAVLQQTALSSMR